MIPHHFRYFNLPTIAHVQPPTVFFPAHSMMVLIFLLTFTSGSSFGQCREINEMSVVLDSPYKNWKLIV